MVWYSTSIYNSDSGSRLISNDILDGLQLEDYDQQLSKVSFPIKFQVENSQNHRIRTQMLNLRIQIIILRRGTIKWLNSTNTNRSEMIRNIFVQNFRIFYQDLSSLEKLNTALAPLKNKILYEGRYFKSGLRVRFFNSILCRFLGNNSGSLKFWTLGELL